MSSRRKNFTSRQKADVFVLDRALCSFSGKSLWLLDYGAAPSSVDWVDHINPAAKGGAADIANGACSSWFYNWARRDQKSPIYLFHRGRPTEHFFTHHETVPEAIAEHLHRFAALHWSDWYFNRAVFHVLIAAGQHGQKRLDGKSFTRNRDYWAKAALRCIEEWSDGASDTTSFRIRKLLPRSPSEDQQVLLELASASSLAAVKKTIAELVPYVRQNWAAVIRMANLDGPKDARILMREVVDDPYIVPRVRKAIRHNVRLLHLR